MEAPTKTRLDPAEDLRYDITFVIDKHGYHCTAKVALETDPPQMAPRLTAKVVVPLGMIKDGHRRQVLVRQAVIAHLAKDFDQINGEGDFAHWSEEGFPEPIMALRRTLGLEPPLAGAH